MFLPCRKIDRSQRSRDQICRFFHIQTDSGARKSEGNSISLAFGQTTPQPRENMTESKGTCKWEESPVPLTTPAIRWPIWPIVSEDHAGHGRVGKTQPADRRDYYACGAEMVRSSQVWSKSRASKGWQNELSRLADLDCRVSKAGTALHPDQHRTVVLGSVRLRELPVHRPGRSVHPGMEGPGATDAADEEPSTDQDECGSIN